MVPDVTGANRACPSYPFIAVVTSSFDARLKLHTDSTLQLTHSSTAFVALQPRDSLAVLVQLRLPLTERGIADVSMFRIA